MSARLSQSRTTSVLGALLFAVAMLLVGCSSPNMPGYQNTFQGYSIPQPLLDRITQKFQQHGLRTAAIDRDAVGRVRLTGSYKDEDEVDQAFIIVRSIVGGKSTSPFYPKDVRERRWEKEASRALADYSASVRANRTGGAAGVRRALVIGISTFMHPKIDPILGEEDARVVADELTRLGYSVTRLLGRHATKTAIESAIAQMNRDLAPNDSLFIYVSSHGTAPVPSSAGGDERKMSIVAYDSSLGQSGADNTDQALYLQKTSVRDNLIQDLARKPTRVTRVVIDTCYSGEMLRGVPSDSRQFILEQNGGKHEREGISVAAWTSGVLASKGIRFDGASSMPKSSRSPGPSAAQAQAAAPTSRSGYTLITATSEGQKSWGPRPDIAVFKANIQGPTELRGSFFTQTFVRWLQVLNGDIQPAFENASQFTTQAVSMWTDPKDKEAQVPRIFSTLPDSEDNISKL
jgi:hypothetical protein